MKAIKVLAVRIENPTVARDKLHNMSQDREESVRAFGARLRGQAATCQYTKACTCTHIVDYTEENVAHTLITGLADPEIKQGLLGEPNQPLSLERAMLYVESKEAAKASVSQLDPGISVGTMKGTRKYKRLPQQGRPQPEVEDDESKCYFCRKTGHGRYPSLTVRSAVCKAFGCTCGKCGKANHTDKVCKSKPSPAQVTDNAIFDNICDITNHGASRPHMMNHHVFDNTKERWVKRQSLPQPSRRLVAKLLPSDYDSLKIAWRLQHAQCTLDRRHARY